MSEVRVRFAPSPTGSFHIGSARTALFNWLYARHTGGVFLLRIEDTDKERNTAEALQVLLDGMRWLGLDWDEGPEVGGPCGPYFQSQRGGIYRAAVERLLASGKAYEKEGAVFFRLEGERYTEFDKYLDAEVEKVRSEPVVFEDRIRGTIERVEARDFPIVRSNGDPVFHLVNVVDDIEMGITHVIRGEDHLTNTTKHIHLFRALGAPVPEFAHLPLILKDPAMGSGKMSKRDRGALLETYRDQHYLPGAVVNFLALLGWSPKDDQEYLPVSELVERFGFAGIQKGAARFDEKKMASLNTQWVHAMTPEAFLAKAREVLAGAGVPQHLLDQPQTASILKVTQPKVRSFEGLPELVGFAFAESLQWPRAELVKMAKKGDPRARATELLEALRGVADWGVEAIEAAVAGCAETTGEKPFAYYPILRFAATAQTGGPELLPLLEALGRDAVLQRIGEFVDQCPAELES